MGHRYVDKFITKNVKKQNKRKGDWNKEISFTVMTEYNILLQPDYPSCTVWNMRFFRAWTKYMLNGGEYFFAKIFHTADNTFRIKKY